MMNQQTRWLSAAALVTAMALVGCGTGQPANNSVSPSTQNAASSTASVTPAEGVARMLTTLDSLNTSIKQTDASSAATAGSQLESTWSSFEDQVHSKFPNDYENVEKSLDPLVAGVHATPLDAGSLSTLSSQLRSALNQLVAKLK